MLFSTEPDIIQAGDGGFDEFTYWADERFGFHRVSVLVPPQDLRTSTDERRAKMLAEAALARALASGQESMNISLGW